MLAKPTYLKFDDAHNLFSMFYSMDGISLKEFFFFNKLQDKVMIFIA